MITDPSLLSGMGGTVGAALGLVAALMYSWEVWNPAEFYEIMIHNPLDRRAIQFLYFFTFLLQDRKFSVQVGPLQLGERAVYHVSRER